VKSNSVEDNLDKFDHQRFLEEARRQSILASAATDDDEAQWSKHADTSGWK
jgi:hypothetical protein